MKTWILDQESKKDPRTIDRPGHSQNCQMKGETLCCPKKDLNSVFLPVAH